MIRTCSAILVNQLRKWKNDYHIYFSLVYLLLISDMMLRPARKLIKDFDVSPTVSSFALIWNSRFFLLLFFFGVLLHDRINFIFF